VDWINLTQGKYYMADIVQHLDYYKNAGNFFTSWVSICSSI